MTRKLTLAAAAAALALVPAACAQWDDNTSADTGAMPTTMIRPTPNSAPDQTSLPETQVEDQGPTTSEGPYSGYGLGVE